jgi:splicing factor U2AF subunit
MAQQQALLAAAAAGPATLPPSAAALVAAAAAGGATLATGVGGTIDTSAARKSREIYIGNLAIGQISPEMLTELFNAALAGMVPDPVSEPPVLQVKMDATGGEWGCQGTGCIRVATPLNPLGSL